MTDSPNLVALRPTAPDRGPDGRFVVGNAAAHRHGLRAGTKSALRTRNRRVSDLLRKYQTLRADEQRPLSPAQLPLARRFVELETLATDLHALARKDPSNHRALESYFAATRALALIAGTLGETATALKQLETLREPQDPVSQLVRLKRQMALEAANG